MKRTKAGYRDIPGSMHQKKAKFFEKSPLLLLLLFFIILLLIFLFYPVHQALMHRDLITARQSPADDPIIKISASAENHAVPLSSSSPAPTETASCPLLMLVNERNPLPENDDLPDLICLNNMETGLFTIKNPDTWIASICFEPLMEMLSAAHGDGLTNWQISEGYRSVEAQQQIWNEKYEKYRNVNGLSEKKALEAVARRVAQPGCSEHHTGLPLDITVPGESFRLTPQAKWLADHCHQYGFIIRYTEEKEYLTGITAEPWHIRYVGREAAAIMKEKNWCLEEYILYRTQ